MSKFSHLVSLSVLIASVACMVSAGVIMYDVSIVPEECTKQKAIDSNYTPAGEVFLLGDLPIYEAPNKNSTRLLINIYDIFGFANDNLKQVSDKFSVENGGFRTIEPDFYRGESWDPANFPPADPAEMQEWLQRVGDWETIVKPDLINIVEHYKDEGVTEFAIFGFCWGGKVATLAASDLHHLFKASAIVHPASVTNEEADGVRTPMFIMPTSSEPDMLPFYEVLQDRFGDNCGHRRFDDMTHGFSGARGNFSDPIIAERVEEVISTLTGFFDRNLQGQ